MSFQSRKQHGHSCMFPTRANMAQGGPELEVPRSPWLELFSCSAPASPLCPCARDGRRMPGCNLGVSVWAPLPLTAARYGKERFAFRYSSIDYFSILCKGNFSKQENEGLHLPYCMKDVRDTSLVLKTIVTAKVMFMHLHYVFPQNRVSVCCFAFLKFRLSLCVSQELRTVGCFCHVGDQLFKDHFVRKYLWLLFHHLKEKFIP